MEYSVKIQSEKKGQFTWATTNLNATAVRTIVRTIASLSATSLGGTAKLVAAIEVIANKMKNTFQA